MIIQPIITILLLLNIIDSANAVEYNYQNPYLNDAINIKNQTQDYQKDISHQKNHNNLLNYQEANAPQSNYYNNHSNIENDANRNNSTEKKLVNNISQKSPSYKINKNEDWLQNPINAINNSNNNQDTKQILNHYQDCNTQNNNLTLIPKNCIIYNQDQTQICQVNKIIQTEDIANYQCIKDQESYQIQCNKSCNEMVDIANITSNNFNNLKNTSDNITFKTANNSRSWVAHPCSHKSYSLILNIEDIKYLKTLKLTKLSHLESINFKVNGKIIYTSNTSDLCGGSRNWSQKHNVTPNEDLLPHIKQGANIIEVIGRPTLHHKFSGNITIKYQKCQAYIEQCQPKYFQEDKCNIVEEICSNSHNPCQNYSIIKSCTPTKVINHCQTLEEKACSQTNSKCLKENNQQDKCLIYQNNFQCPINTNITQIAQKLTKINQETVVIQEKTDFSQCQNLQDDSSCEFISQTCLSENTIENQPQNCQNYQRHYQCSENNIDDSCQDKLQQQNCQYQDTICLKEDNETQNCQRYQTNFLCPNSNNKENQGANCLSDNIEYQKDQDLTSAASALQALQSLNQEFSSENQRAFKGNNLQCSMDLIDFKDCCGGDDWGWGNCDSQEELLKQKKEKSRCIYIGAYCSKKEKLTKTCLKESRSYCCFNSLIAKIIQHQGRGQIGQSFGDPKSPNCQGILITDIQSMNFSKMNFSELTADIARTTNDNLPSQEELRKQVQQQVEGYYE